LGLLLSITIKAQIVVTSDGSVRLNDDFYVTHYYDQLRVYPMVHNNALLGLSTNQYYQIRGQYHYATSTLLTSDFRLKENFRTIDEPLKKIMQLNGKKYDFIKEKSDSTGSEQEKAHKIMLKKDRLGFIAQEVEGIIPEAVVYEKEDDAYYIDYNALIPLIVEAMKEQQAKIEALEATISQMGNASPEMKSATPGNSMVNDPMLNVATLAQNIPNPFTNNTRIDIYLPETVKNANLYVYNMQGVQIMSINISERANTSVTIEGYALQAGMYLYTLIADGKEVDTKKMILTK
jgi:hypothetical protein